MKLLSGCSIAPATLTGLDNGLWSIEWWNTVSGKQVAAGKTNVSGGSLRLDAPPFQVDIAAGLKKLDEHPNGSR